MPATLAPPAPSTTPAVSTAARNFHRNLATLPTTNLAPLPDTFEFLHARDGSLTALDAAGQWIAGCSVPRRLAERLFSRAQATGAVCLLAPNHAAQIAVVLNQLKPSQAILVILPDLEAFTLALHCEDFSAELSRQRLFFAAGEGWESQLHDILTSNPGLPIPSHFVKSLLLADADASSLMRSVQDVLSQVAQSRAAQIRSLLASSEPGSARRTLSSPKTGAVCILAPQTFRLWDDHGHTLAQTLQQDVSHGWRLLDADNPAGLSDLLLAQAASTASAIITPNIARHDLPRVIPAHVPVITWLTKANVPPYDSKFPHDALILAQDALMPAAIRAGWPTNHLRIGAVPQFAICNGQLAICNSQTTPTLSLIANTLPLPAESPPFDLSTHRILWDMIRQELLANPFALGHDLPAYLRSRMTRLGIDEAGLDAQRFCDHLLLPAYQQGLAGLLISAHLPVKLFGANWDSTPFAAHSAGPLHTRDAFHFALSCTTALIHPFPFPIPLPVNVPTITAANATDLLQSAKIALSGRSDTPVRHMPETGVGQECPTYCPLTAQTVLELIA